MIVVTAPTGQIGRQLLLNILDSRESIRVRVIARDAARLPESIRGRVEVVQGSHGNRDDVDRAFLGADSIFWLVPPDLRARTIDAAYVEFTRAACDAFKRHAVRRVVAISALGRGTPWADKAGLVTASLATDDLIASTGVSFRALTAPSFMENILRQIQSIKSDGVFVMPIAGDRKLPTCATRDIAAVASRLLLDQTWDGQDTVPVLGPEDLSFNDMARIMSEVLGKPICFQQISFEAYKTRLLDRGTSEAMAQGMVDMMTAKNEGLDNAEPRTTQSSTPTSFNQWCEEALKPAVLG